MKTVPGCRHSGIPAHAAQRDAATVRVCRLTAHRSTGLPADGIPAERGMHSNSGTVVPQKSIWPAYRHSGIPAEITLVRSTYAATDNDNDNDSRACQPEGRLRQDHIV